MADPLESFAAHRTAEINGMKFDIAPPCPECCKSRACDGKTCFCVESGCPRFLQESPVPRKYELRFEPATNRSGCRVLYPNGNRQFGIIYQEVDGFFVFDFDAPGPTGFFGAWIFRELADKLDELNAAWSAQIDKELNK